MYKASIGTEPGGLSQKTVCRFYFIKYVILLTIFPKNSRRKRQSEKKKKKHKK